MQYCDLKMKLITLFDNAKLNSKLDEWGFYNEMEREIRQIGYATSLTPETIIQAKQMQVDLLLTHHDSWEFVFGLKEKCDAMLKENNITHGYFHGPLDDAPFGTMGAIPMSQENMLCILNNSRALRK